VAASYVGGTVREARQDTNGGAESPQNGRVGVAPARTPEITIVAPTRNEEAVIGAFIDSLDEHLAGIHAELIVVDDSDDGTPGVVYERGPSAQIDVAIIHRAAGERDGGLGGAVVAGIAAARAPWVCVMDADLQHPPSAIAQLRAQAETTGSDLVVASRFRDGGSIAGLSAVRTMISVLLVLLARLAFPRRLRDVSDPLTGFFLVRRDALDLAPLRPNGFKILLEILVRTPNLAVSEIAFRFGKRPAGDSKASVREVVRYLALVWRLRIGTVGARFGRFGLVGVTGIVVNSLALAFFRSSLGFSVLAAALLATQCSSLWNFALVERFVFRGNTARRSLAGRAVAFFAVNNLAFLVRGPMILALTGYFDLYYLLANLLSICALTIARFALADRWIWGTGRETTRALYDIHGIATIDSEVALPELARFRVATLATQASIRVDVGSLAKISRLGHSVLEGGEEVITYREGVPGGFAVRVEMGKTISISVSPLVRRSPHVLYTNCVEPVLRWHFAEQGIALVHAACVAVDDRAFLITARTDTGKTTTILRLLDSFPRAQFISDDLTFIASDGTVASYPKPLTISQHTLHAVRRPNLTRRQRLGLVVQARLHSREGRSIGMLLASKGLPAATMNAVVQALIPPPKYDITKLVPTATLCTEARLAGLFVIERATDDVSRSLADDEAIETLMENCDDAYGFPPYPLIAQFLYTRGGVDLRELEQDVVRSGLASVPATLLRSSSMDWWQRVPQLMGIALDETPVAAGVPDGVEMPVPLPLGIESAEQVA
jgi:dolichol-phosphate mannosyltransferase